jgi:hypothetical protein
MFPKRGVAGLESVTEVVGLKSVTKGKILLYYFLASSAFSSGVYSF